MDREILCRGKRLDNGEWVEGDRVEQNNPEYHDYIITEFAADVDNRHIDILTCDIYEVDPSTVGRYTGLKDRNGKRIFEGDIIKVPWMNEYRNRFVYYKNGLFKADSIDGFFSASLCSFVGFDLPEFHCEVIGNIHDNPEMVKE